MSFYFKQIAALSVRIHTIHYEIERVGIKIKTAMVLDIVKQIILVDSRLCKTVYIGT